MEQVEYRTEEIVEEITGKKKSYINKNSSSRLIFVNIFGFLPKMSCFSDTSSISFSMGRSVYYLILGNVISWSR